MRRKTCGAVWGLAAAIILSGGAGCGEGSTPDSGTTRMTGPAPARARLTGRIPPERAKTLKDLRDRNPVSWVGDSVQSVIRGYRVDYTARRKSHLPLKGLCEGLKEYFTTRNAWGRSLAIGHGPTADLLTPRCSAPARKIRFFSTSLNRRAPEGDAYVTSRSMALLDSLEQLTARVDAEDRPAGEAVATLTVGIDRIETLAANSSLTDQEFELVETTISGLTGTIAEAQAMLPVILPAVYGSIDECAERLGYEPSDPSECDREVYEMFGPMSYQLPRPVLMCAIAMNKPPVAGGAPRKVCDGHEIIEGMAHGFIGGAVGGAWAGLIGTGGLGVPLTALLGGIGGATSGLAVGLAKTFWCELHK